MKKRKESYNVCMKLSRHIQLENVPNLRDLGGIENIEGKKIRPNLIFRSSYFMHASEKDIETLKKEGIKEIIDFRGDNEFTNYPDPKIDGVSIHRIPMHVLNREDWDNYPHYPHKSYPTENSQMDYLQEWFYVYSNGSANILMENSYAKTISLKEMQNKWAEMIRLLLSSDGGVAFHCQDGKDRTGIAAMLILKLLKVDDETVKEEYVLSKRYLKEKIEKDYKQAKEHNVPEPILSELRTIQGCEASWIKSALDKFNELGGYPTYFTKELKLTEEEIKAFQDKYLI